ncbi:YciI family protein [Roseateles microcysteis]|uniref:YciI family protein n=1 Tax=Roseateles microcysteis TaxID=3119057 RepID=UPI002FE64010
MQYLLMIYSDDQALEAAGPEVMPRIVAEFDAYTEALQKAGVLLGGERLHPAEMTTTVRVSGGKTQVLNGPYADTKEQLGGYYVIEAPDLDAAIAWAARCPGASYGTMEVRPVWAM